LQASKWVKPELKPQFHLKKSAGDMVQVVEHMPSKDEAVS
jgi:hypothetical protein